MKYAFLKRARAAVWFLAALVLVSLTPSAADIVRLKSGRAVNGQVRGEEDGFLIVRTLGGDEKIPAGEIEGIEVGYTGLSFCVVHRGDTAKDCNGVLHLMNPESVILGTGDALTERRELRRGEFERVEFRKAAEGQQILPTLTKGIELELIVKSPEAEGGEAGLTGVVEDADLESVTVRLPDGTTRQFREADLIGGKYAPRLPVTKEKKPEAPFLIKLVPVAYQYYDGSPLKGTLFLLGYSAAGAGFAVAYSRARAAERDASNSLSYWFFYDQQYQTRFRYYQRVQRAIGGAALIMYGLHLWDAFWSDDSETASAVQLPDLRAGFSPGRPGRTFPLEAGGDHVEVFRLTINF